MASVSRLCTIIVGKQGAPLKQTVVELTSHRAHAIVSGLINDNNCVQGQYGRVFICSTHNFASIATQKYANKEEQENALITEIQNNPSHGCIVNSSDKESLVIIQGELYVINQEQENKLVRLLGPDYQYTITRSQILSELALATINS